MLSVKVLFRPMQKSHKELKNELLGSAHFTVPRIVFDKREICFKIVHSSITLIIFHFILSDELSLILRENTTTIRGRKESNLEFSHTKVMHFFVT